MVKLTVDLIQGAAQFTNTVKDRELDLRGKKRLNLIKRFAGLLSPKSTHYNLFSNFAFQDTKFL